MRTLYQREYVEVTAGWRSIVSFVKFYESAQILYSKWKYAYFMHWRENKLIHDFGNKTWRKEAN